MTVAQVKELVDTRGRGSCFAVAMKKKKGRLIVSARGDTIRFKDEKGEPGLPSST